MEQEGENIAPILKVAWERYAQFDSAATRLLGEYYRIRRFTLMFGVIAPYLAVLSTEIFFDTESVAGRIIKIISNLVPLTASILAVFGTRLNNYNDGLIMRAGAEAIHRDIYFYRTILKKNHKRYQILKARLAEIQRQMYRGLKGEFSFEQYTDTIPPYYNPSHKDSDPGLTDLDGDQYFRYRLVNQLLWHNRRINRYKLERNRLTSYILFIGFAGSLLSGLGGTFTIGVTVTVSLTMAFLSWQELRNLDSNIRNYSKVVTELTLIHDNWQNLESEERTETEFHRMVYQCESVLSAQTHEYIRIMQEALVEAETGSEASLINGVIDEARESANSVQKAIAAS